MHFSFTILMNSLRISSSFLHLSPPSSLLNCELCELGRLFYQRHTVEVIFPEHFFFNPKINDRGICCDVLEENMYILRSFFLTAQFLCRDKRDENTGQSNVPTTKVSLFGDQMEAHLSQKLILLQHHHGDWIHLLTVKVKLHTSRRISQEISFVLSKEERTKLV